MFLGGVREQLHEIGLIRKNSAHQVFPCLILFFSYFNFNSSIPSNHGAKVKIKVNELSFCQGPRKVFVGQSTFPGIVFVSTFTCHLLR